MDHKPPLHTVIVEGPLGFAMRRFVAANSGDVGLQILSFSQLAARLAGGFVRPITAEILEPAIQAALNEKGFKEIERVRRWSHWLRILAREGRTDMSAVGQQSDPQSGGQQSGRSRRTGVSALR